MSLVFPVVASAEKTLAERLGYKKDARLVIVHADDLGQTHSVNAASMKAFDIGLVNSGAILVTCPWVSEIVAYAKKHPDLDLGLQFTLRSEWDTVRWGPILGRDKVPSLADEQGYFHMRKVADHAKPAEAEAEIRAQLERLIALGVRPSYVDNHTNVLFANRGLFEVYLRVAREYGLPALILKDHLAPERGLSGAVGPDDIVLDGMISIRPGVAPGDWAKAYVEMLKKLAPGVYFLEAHLGYDDAEMRAAANGKEDWGAAWRQRETDFFTSDTFRKAIKDNNIALITWREIGKLIKKRP